LFTIRDEGFHRLSAGCQSTEVRSLDENHITSEFPLPSSNPIAFELIFRYALCQHHQGLQMPTRLLLTLLLATSPLLAEVPLKAQVKPEQKLRSISGTVQDAEGNPVVAEIWIHWSNAKPELLVTSKADGTFKVSVPFSKNEYDTGGMLIATAKGHGSAFQYHGKKFTPESMVAESTVMFKLPKERKLSGRVVDMQEKPVAGSLVVAKDIRNMESEAVLDKKLLAWAKEGSIYNIPFLQPWLTFNDGSDHPAFRELNRSPFFAITDASGNYEISGLGNNQLITLLVKGEGLASRELITLNRDGFNAGPLLELTEARERQAKADWTRWKLNGPDPIITLEPEKILRGKVTDELGNPLPEVQVTFSRPTHNTLVATPRAATTDKDGKYEIRGAKKHNKYMLEVPSNVATGTMMCQKFVADTDGYKPLEIDIICKRGVVITGKMTNKATGEPIARAGVRTEALKINSFVKHYPGMSNSQFGMSTSVHTDKDGTFRVVTIPGPVLLIGRTYTNTESEFVPPVPDPNFPKCFKGNGSSIAYLSANGGEQYLNGDWCKVIEPKVTDTELTVNIEMVPAPKKLVKVIDNEGNPVLGTKATGTSHIEFHTPREFTDTSTLTVLNLEPKKDRLLVVYHEKSKQVGSLMLNADTKDPVVKLDYGGTILGRAVDKDGKPLVGLKVSATFAHRQATEAFKGFHKNELPVTDANGEFRLSGLMPGLECKLYYKLDGRSYGLEKLPTPVYTIKKPGEFVKTGDMILLIDHE
jgi:uncharacterized GH25 family protein